MDCDSCAVEDALDLARTTETTSAEETGLRLASKVAPKGAAEDEIDMLSLKLPQDLRRFWRLARMAELFVDVDYDQWGLDVLTPAAASELTLGLCSERAEDFRPGDLVVGTFRGDSDFVLVRTDVSSADFGMVLVGLPLDSRSDWYLTGLCFGQFLTRFVEARGQKFWES